MHVVLFIKEIDHLIKSFEPSSPYYQLVRELTAYGGQPNTSYSIRASISRNHFTYLVHIIQAEFIVHVQIPSVQFPWLQIQNLSLSTFSDKLIAQLDSSKKSHILCVKKIGIF